MIKFSKIVKAVTSVIAPKAEEPTKETPKQEPTVKAEEEVKAEEVAPVKMEAKHYVACPHCTKKFEVAYDPTDPTKHGEEEVKEEVAEEVAPKTEEKVEEKVEEKAEEKVEEKKSEEVQPHKEPDGDEVEPKDDKDEDKKAKKALGSNSEWHEAIFGAKKATKENMFHKAVYEAFPIENLK